eukprot:1149792-Pelagomonas_calceolata.AAC.1
MTKNRHALICKGVWEEGGCALDGREREKERGSVQKHKLAVSTLGFKGPLVRSMLTCYSGNLSLMHAASGWVGTVEQAEQPNYLAEGQTPL